MVEEAGRTHGQPGTHGRAERKCRTRTPGVRRGSRPASVPVHRDSGVVTQSQPTEDKGPSPAQPIGSLHSRPRYSVRQGPLWQIRCPSP
ncbi:hypothetical protein ANANG_G00092070 [Anguilla anguilla]|uniref:Uncharacterized protein n=1 Tax=Anguilla anguilla TaxID=7936 RepID=A0A9D3MP21_ANGAN|nr:hypothetical protein ANANG_G00092070 [Anguilla anguilla]